MVGSAFARSHVMTKGIKKERQHEQFYTKVGNRESYHLYQRYYISVTTHGMRQEPVVVDIYCNVVKDGELPF